MKKVVLFGFIFIAVITAAFVVGVASPKPVYAQACDSCGNINDPSDCSACGGRLYCTCACDVLCWPPDNCACEATLCQTSPNGDECGYDVYGDPVTCFWCGGTPENCTFNCPSWINPCITYCSGGPTPTPTPTLPPGTPTPTPAPACTAPSGLGGADSCDPGDGLLDITWSWNAVAGAIDYLLTVDNNSDFSSPVVSVFVNTTSYTTTDLTPGTYYARVRVNTSDGTCSAPSIWSASTSVTNVCPAPTPTPTPTPTPIPACAAPGGLSGADSCDGGDGMIDITWSWSAVAGASTYRFQMDDDPGFGSLNVNVTTAATSRNTTNLAPGTWYARVRVETSTGACTAPSAWSATASATNACTACAAPVNNGPASACVDQTTYNITWNFSESAGANEYQFVVSTGSGGAFWANVIYNSGWQSSAFFFCGGGSCSLPMTGSTSGTTYYSRERARGLSCPTSAWSNEQSAFQDCFVACTAPIGLSGIGACDLGDGLLDITWSWGAIPGATSYRLQVDDDPAFGSLDVNGPPTALTSQDTNNLASGTWYGRVRVEVDDGVTCTAPSVWSGTVTISEACLATIQGTIYDDSLGQASIGPSGICEFPGPLPGTAASSGTVTIDDDLGGVWTGGVGAAGDYTVSNVPIGTDLYDATFTPVSFVCMCPAPDPGNPGSCFPYTDIIDAPQTGVNFFVSQVRDRWVQTVGGDVHVEGDIGITIPDTCAAAPICSPEFSLPGTDDFGVVSSSTGSTDYGPSGSVSIPGWEAASDYLGPQFLFDFWRKETDPPTPLADLNNRPSPPEGVYEIVWSGSDLTLTGNWNNIPGAGPLTIFVNFDNPSRTLILNPNPPGITLDTGSPDTLLTIITNGNIHVADIVEQIEGIYLVDGIFRTCVTDNCGYDSGTGTSYQLKINGSVIGWSGVDLERDLFTQNVDTPGELFTYEPEFIPRLPEFILRAIYTWEEVAP